MLGGHKTQWMSSDMVLLFALLIWYITGSCRIVKELRSPTRVDQGIADQNADTTYGHLRPPAANLRPPTATYGHLRPPTATYGHLRPPTATYGHLRPPTATYGTLSWNRLFHVKDDGFGEDRHVMQHHGSGAVLSLLRNVAITLLRSVCSLWSSKEPLTGRAQRLGVQPTVALLSP